MEIELVVIVAVMAKTLVTIQQHVQHVVVLVLAVVLLVAVMGELLPQVRALVQPVRVLVLEVTGTH